MDYIGQDQNSRRVVPNWRFFSETFSLGELGNVRNPEAQENPYAIDEYVETWLNRKSFSTAGDLISAAITNGQKENRYAKEAALYISEQDTTHYPVLARGAKYILSDQTNYFNQQTTTIHTGLINKLRSAQDMGHKIREIRHKLNITPYNAILYVDMARTQLTVGNQGKAVNLMQVALQLDHNNRFVVRAAVRLFHHLGDIDRANSVLRSTPMVKYDPWLIAADITTGMLRKKNSVHIKTGMNIISSQNYHPFSYTELASSLGTLEYYQGTRKKSRNFFKTSMLSPNDNSLAQAEWVAPKLQFQVNKITGVKLDYEARFYKELANGNLETAIEELVDWIIDMPYSQKPIYMGAGVAMTYMRDFEFAEAILGIGVKATPENTDFINNMAYALARQNKTKEAQVYIEKLKKTPQDKMTKAVHICLNATQGLIAYRNGQPEMGKSLYQEAIKESEEIKLEKPELYNKAIINLKREELIASGYSKMECLDELHRLDIPKEDNELKMLIEEVEQLYKKHNPHVVI